MGLLAWWIAPHLNAPSGDPTAWFETLTGLMTLGLLWQFVLVVALLYAERRTLRWAVLREALWLSPPTNPISGRRGGRMWLVCVPLIVAFALESLIPDLPHSEVRDLMHYIGSETGQAFFKGNWAWYGVILTLLTFNTVLGEELLFRGFLLPRMAHPFGRMDWVVNGILFATYHLHSPWVIPAALLDTVILSWPSKRYRSAWIGIIVHSFQSLFIAAMVFMLVV
ncbi:MAG: CPBP family intramembrane glutamic endopeptidase [Lysobacteraceae bacterium]